MPFTFRDGVLVETTEPDTRQVLRPQPTPSQETGTADDSTTTDPWPLGAVVAFRRKLGTTGFGQVVRSTPTGFVTIQTWLPCPTKQIHAHPSDVRLVATLDDLHRLLDEIPWLRA